VGDRTTLGIFGFGRVDDYTMENQNHVAFGHGGGPRLVCTFILRVRVVRLASAKDIASWPTIHAANHHCAWVEATTRTDGTSRYSSRRFGSSPGMEKHTHEWMDYWMDGLLDGWIDGLIEL
jgi:hypothetical protein